MNYRWINKRGLAKEIDDVKLRGSKLVAYRGGKVNAFRKGLAISASSKIDFFQGILETWRLEKLFRHGETDFVRVRASEAGLTVKFRPGNITSLYTKPFVGEYFPDFDFWDPHLEWHQCPDNLVDGITYIEGILAKESKKIKKSDHFGIHVEENYVGRHDRYSVSRFRLRTAVPFSMILKPVGLRQLGLRLKSRRLQRVAYCTIPDMGKGVLFDYGNLRVWNAALEHEGRNLVPEVNTGFDFRIDNFFKLPPDILFALELIKLMFKTTMDFQTGRAIISITIGKNLSVYHGPHVTRIRLPKSVRPHPISFSANFFSFAKLVTRETIIGYGNPDSAKGTKGRVYLRDQQGEHVVGIAIEK
jgi:hypothetical protein